MRIVFLGTDEFAEIALKKLAASRHKIELVVTQPDRPKGRGQKNVPGVVKIFAAELGIPVIQPESVKNSDTVNQILAHNPDIIVVVSYGEYIPQAIFNAPKHKSINVHPSLLPRWRGASPIQYALLAGDEMTGVTVQYVHKYIDAGDIIVQEKVEINPDDNYGSLCDKLYPFGSELLLCALDMIENNEANPMVQDESRVTKAPKIGKDDLWIDWSEDTLNIRNKIRAFSPSPGARARFRDAEYKILESDSNLFEVVSMCAPGYVLALSDEGPVVVCGSKGLVITRLQPPGKNPISGRDFMNGYRIQAGEIFSGKPDGAN